MSTFLLNREAWMGQMDLMTFEKAAERLGIPESEIEELIDAGKLSLHPYVGDVFLDAEEVRSLALARRPPATGNPANPRPASVGWSPIARIRDLMDSGVREISAPHAAKLLKVTPSQVQHLMREGRLNGEKRGRYRWIDLMEVEMYAMDQAHWSGLGGRWTPCGKQEARDPAAGLNLVAEVRQRSGTGREHPHRTADESIDSRRAAEVLGVSIARIYKLAAAGTLTAVRSTRASDHPDALGRPIVRSICLFSLAEVQALADRRERIAWERAIPPQVWNKRTSGKPLIRTKIEAPANDCLIARQEAAELLGIAPTHVSMLVAQGRLFGWQTHPGKPGCRLWLSENQVLRYRDDPDRLKRREAAISNRGPREPSACGLETDRELWMEDVGLATAIRYAERSNADLEHGEFLNTRQAAKLLGVTKGAVQFLRNRGRISGYQKPRRKGDGGGQKWWFYKKDDVYNLLADGEYLRRRDRSRRAKLLSLGRDIPSMETEW